MYRTRKAHLRRRSAVVAVIALGALSVGGVATMAGAAPRHGARWCHGSGSGFVASPAARAQ